MISFPELLLVAFVACVGVSSTKVAYEDCGSTKATVVDVDIAPCENPKLCVLHKGHTHTITVRFNTNEQITKAKAVLIGHLPGGGQQQILAEDACEQINCPLAAGGPHTYSLSVPVRNTYPSIRVVVEFNIEDQDGRKAVCLKVPTKIA